MKPVNSKKTETKLLNVPRSRGGHNAKNSETRRKFLQAFEHSAGNIFASCHYTGIHRMTFYRWMKGRSQVNRKFQKAIKNLRPVELLKDMAEAVILTELKNDSLRAAKFVLKNLGWPENIQQENNKLDEDVVHLKKLIL